MISGLGSSQAANYAQYAAMAKKIDTDGDGEVSETEFVNGAPQGVSSDQAKSIFDLLDPQKTGSIQDSDLANAFSQLSDATKFLLIQQQQQGGAEGSEGPDGSEGPGGPQDAQTGISNLFSKLDTNGDGSLSRDEFVAGRPKGVSEDQAGKLYDQIASAAGATGTDSSGGLSEAQFAQGIQTEQQAAAGKAHGHHGHHGGGGGGGGKTDDDDDAAQTFDALDTNQDGFVSLEEFMAGKPKDVSDDDAKSLFDKLTNGDSSASVSKDQFVEGMQEQQQAQQSDTQQQNDPRDMLKELMSSLQSQTTNSNGQTPLDQFAQAIDAYRTASQQAFASSMNTSTLLSAAA